MVLRAVVLRAVVLRAAVLRAPVLLAVVLRAPAFLAVVLRAPAFLAVRLAGRGLAGRRLTGSGLACACLLGRGLARCRLTCTGLLAPRSCGQWSCEQSTYEPEPAWPSSYAAVGLTWLRSCVAVVLRAAVFLAVVLRAVLFLAVLFAGTVTASLAAGSAFPFTMSLRVELAPKPHTSRRRESQPAHPSAGYDRSAPLCGSD